VGTGSPGVVPSGGPVPTATAVQGWATGTVPNVVGMQEVEATSVLQQAGFYNVKVINAPEPSGQPKGTVFSQSPSGGSFVAAATVITIYA
jgi:beta-lactam-binding protein with PASTA domain